MQSNYGFVVPVYNHPHYLADLISYLDSFHLPIVLVNDGSDDACSQILKALAEQYSQIHLIEHEVNKGKGQAVMTGLRAAYELGLSHALQLDSDGQHCWDDIPKFIEQSHQHPDAMVIGQPYFDASIPKKR
ncbi:glycosyltransferase family 2 protein, partial [Acinetobacter baumannii]